MDVAGVIGALSANTRRLRAAEAHEATLVARLAEVSSVVDRESQIPGTEHLHVMASDGTPAVAEFASLELAAALGLSTQSAAGYVIDVLNLQYRMPRLWRAVQAGEVQVWRARKIVSLTRELSLDQAIWVDGRLDGVIAGLGIPRCFRLVEGLVARANPELLAERERRARTVRQVVLGRASSDGLRDIHAITGLAEAAHLDGMLNRIADILAEEGDTDDRQIRRSKALGWLASPARALHLLQGHINDPNPLHDSDPGPLPDHRLCGTVTTDPARLLPPVKLYVHLSEESLTDPATGVVRVEQLSPVTVGHLSELLSDCRVTVQPVIDLNDVTPVDSYEIPERIREAVRLTRPVETFPYSSRSARSCDLDHTTAWTPNGPPAQTGIDNLTPLSRKVHRAKTHAFWRIRRTNHGDHEWTTPAGQRFTVRPDGTTMPADRYSAIEDQLRQMMVTLPKPTIKLDQRIDVVHPRVAVVG